MVSLPPIKRSYAIFGALIGAGIGFIIGLIINKIGGAIFFCGLLGMLIGSFKMKK